MSESQGPLAISKTFAGDAARQFMVSGRLLGRDPNPIQLTGIEMIAVLENRGTTTLEGIAAKAIIPPNGRAVPLGVQETTLNSQDSTEVTICLAGAGTTHQEWFAFFGGEALLLKGVAEPLEIKIRVSTRQGVRLEESLILAPPPALERAIEVASARPPGPPTRPRLSVGGLTSMTSPRGTELTFRLTNAGSESASAIQARIVAPDKRVLGLTDVNPIGAGSFQDHVVLRATLGALAGFTLVVEYKDDWQRKYVQTLPSKAGASSVAFGPPTEEVS